jgi:hypothetical protein
MALGWNLPGVVHDPLGAPEHIVVFMPSIHVGSCGWQHFRLPLLVGSQMDNMKKKTGIQDSKTKRHTFSLQQILYRGAKNSGKHERALVQPTNLLLRFQSSFRCLPEVI